MGTGYAILSIYKDSDNLSSLSHHLLCYQSEVEGFYAVWSGMPPPTVATVMLKDIPSLTVQKNVHLMFVGTVTIVDTMLLNAQKARINLLRRLGILLLLYRIEWIKARPSQAKLIVV